ncbi:MAG: hypothetical protein JWM91_3400 [Rhodospirillales bacterium]|nr:hypothetical protein [Rhodospirillales bacterium]
MMMLVPAVLVASNLIQVSAAVCPASHTEVRVSQDIKAPRIDNTKTTEQLKAMKISDVLTADLKFAETTGLTAATIAVDSEIRTKSSGPEKGPICIWPSVISVKLSTAPSIYVDASHGTCRQNVAMEHEMEHVAIDRNLIDRYVPIFRIRVTAMADAIGSVPVASYDSSSMVRERIEEKINAMLSVTYDSMAIERASAHQEHDSPDEYRRVSAACPTVSVDAPATTPHSHARNGKS